MRDAALLLLWAAVALRPGSGMVELRGERRPELPDVSSEVCWAGASTKERCCKGDPGTQSDCWKDQFSFGECCPNADCWDDKSFTYERCCDTARFGERGNAGCWSGAHTYDHCCLANRTSKSWVDVLVGSVDTDQFYGIDEFFTDAQYGEDFGYYSTGRVLRAQQHMGKDAQEFAHFTTYPMALSPHFGRVLCRLLFVMWLQLGEREPFRVVELGAGSGQLAVDIQQCVRSNELGIAPAAWRRWAAAFEYVIVERSPALAHRQRERGLRVVEGDAQTGSACKPTLAALAASSACAGAGGAGAPKAPECAAGASAELEGVGASVVLSNELLDAFAPVRLRLPTSGQPNVTDCGSWEEMRLVHTISEPDLREIIRSLRHSEERIEALLADLRAYTSEVFCQVANSTVGQAATECSPTSSCLAIMFGLSELMYHADLQLPSASHNMRLRLRKDYELCARFREVAAKLEASLENVVVLPRQVYQQLRHQMREEPAAEVAFLARVQTRQVPVPLSAARCEELSWWLETHEARTTRLLDLYGDLGYPAIQFLVRPGERKFAELADCLVGSSGGFMLSIDYGASFEALGHSYSVDPLSDGIFSPPVPQELLQDLPDCYASWPTCAGRVDWTSFVDFTNLAAAGESLGWRTLLYGPQSLLEQISDRNMTVDGKSYVVPGYSVIANSWASSHVQSWYGRELVASSAAWHQRWTSFKALLLEKPAAPGAAKPSVTVFPSWHLDSSEADACWRLDPSMLPLADWIHQQREEDPRTALDKLSEEVNDKLGRQYAEAYEDAQLAVRLVDWLVAFEGCQSLSHERVAAIVASAGDSWHAVRQRLLEAWESVWGSEAVERVAWRVFRRLAQRPQVGPARPFECLAEQTYAALCEEPGDSVPSRSPIFPEV